ncbi:endonuclease/exonuclease/phosphatase family protein [Enterovibrio norvegicus]|uniref:endonuclease/exonuclease/phosphatase family protein n=1 Tax=Enterovibrio norvegicus TaxID=188144 RepID=UPI003D119E42
MKKTLKKRWLILGTATLIGAISVWIYDMLEVPEVPRLASSQKDVRCLNYPVSASIDVSNPLSIAVWNIYKQQLDGWEDELLALSKTSSLILLQEAQSSQDLQHYISARQWHSNQAFAFSVNDEVAGVMTLSELAPQKVCAYTKVEPYLRLPKSALYSEFPLSNGQTLSVINIHSINFTFGIEEYREQLNALVGAVTKLDGPVIVAGDFNTWSDKRLKTVKTELNRIGLQEAVFDTDARLKVFSLPLDHIYYRDLVLNDANSRSTLASDHAIMTASFSFNVN